jgi:hypothetical protein
MIVRIENGNGKLIGGIDLDVSRFTDRAWDANNFAAIEWIQKVQHTLNTFSYVKKSMEFKVTWLIPYGWSVRTKWKETERLKRARLIKPYKDVIQSEYI